MSKLVFIKSNAEIASVDGDSLSHIKYITHNRIGLYFDLSQSGAKTTLEVQLNVTIGRTNEAVTSLTQQLSGRGVYVFTDVVLNTGEYSSNGVERTSPAGHPSDFVISVHSIAYTEGVLATGPQGPTGPAGPQGPAGANGSNGTNGTNGTNGSDALALGGNNQTLTGNRDIEVSGNDLNFKDGGVIIGRYDNADNEWKFNKSVNVQGDFKVTATSGVSSSQIKLNEPALGGDNGVILKAPSTNLTGDVTFVIPDADGSANQLIKTDGSGNLSFTSPAKEYVSFNGAFYQNNTSFVYFSISSASTTETSSLGYLTILPIGFACRLVDVTLWVQSGTARDETINAYNKDSASGGQQAVLGSVTESCAAGDVTVFTFNTSTFDFAAGAEVSIGWTPNTAPNGVSWKARFELL